MDNSQSQASPVASGSAPPILGLTKREEFAKHLMAPSGANNSSMTWNLERGATHD